MCLEVPAEARCSAPSPNPDPHENTKGKARDPVLLFTSRGDCPARLSPEDLSDPDRYRRRLTEWLLRQR